MNVEALPYVPRPLVFAPLPSTVPLDYICLGLRPDVIHRCYAYAEYLIGLELTTHWHLSLS